jgi:bacteriorhodopsin
MAWLPYILGYLAVGFCISIACIIAVSGTKREIKRLSELIALIGLTMLLWPGFVIYWLMT